MQTSVQMLSVSAVSACCCNTRTMFGCGDGGKKRRRKSQSIDIRALDGAPSVLAFSAHGRSKRVSDPAVEKLLLGSPFKYPTSAL